MGPNLQKCVQLAESLLFCWHLLGDHPNPLMVTTSKNGSYFRVPKSSFFALVHTQRTDDAGDRWMVWGLGWIVASFSGFRMEGSVLH